MINPGSIRAAAQTFRAELGMQDQLVLDFRDILKKLGRMRPKTRVKVVSGEKTSILAWTEIGPDANAVLCIQESVMEKLAHDDPHARYIIAHEIGHIVLNHQLGFEPNHKSDFAFQSAAPGDGGGSICD